MAADYILVLIYMTYDNIVGRKYPMLPFLAISHQVGN